MLALATKALTFALYNWRLLAILAASLAVTEFGIWQFHRGAESVRAEDRAALQAASSRQAKAVSAADQQRLKDTQTVTQLQADLSHAADAVPDSTPSAARVALACQRLRFQAGPGAKLPAECGSDRSAQASSRP
jgi:hypothetical protein